MLTSFPLEIARPVFKLVKEIWETKVQLTLMAGMIFFQGGSFSVLWALIKAPPAPFISRSMATVAFMGCALATQCYTISWMWKQFQRVKSDMPSPWKDIDIRYVLQFLPDWSPLGSLHFLYSRLGSRRRQVVRETPWHFRHTLNSAHAGLSFFLMAKFGGLEGLLGTGLGMIAVDTIWLLHRQIGAAVGQNQAKITPMLDYRHKPRFAWAAVSQGLVFVVALLFIKLDHVWPVYILVFLPVTSVATMLLYLTYGHEPDYLNDSIAVQTIHRDYESKFCETCEATIFSRGRRNNTHHLIGKSLQKSAQDGCRICASVWEQRSRIPQDFVSILKYWKPATTYERGVGTLCIRYSQDPYGTQRCQFQIRKRQVADRWAGRSESLDIRKRITLTEMSNHTGSDESLELATRWLQHCTIHHGLCCANQDETFRPSRLLFLENNSICIHTTEDMPKKIRYLTLSHCWGKLHIIRLLEFNESSFRQNIPFSYLPKTFQDAIKITQRLGFRYLWIDSLCIIQDSADDWLHEAKLMGKIYKNSACNIAASDAPDSKHGCLYPRNPRTLQPEPMRIGSGEEEEYLINETDIYENHILYTRAWVLQEALLARRTIDCGRGQLFWRCGEMRASEVFPGGVPTNIYHEDHPASKFKAISAENDQVILNANILEQRLSTEKTRSQIPIAPGKGSVERYTNAPFAFWAAIVSYYTGLKLTKDTDRIVAVAGITDVFRPFFGEHWFGMWRIFMPLELLWTVEGRSQRPSTLRAPTWSWFSLEGPVSYVSCEFKYRRDVLITQFIDAEMTGEHGMRLRLSTPLLRARWTGSGESRRRCSISSIEGETRYLSYRGIPTLPDSYGGIYFDHWGDDMPAEDVFCMCIQIHKAYGRTESMGLVLQEVEDGVFERIGHFTDYGGLIIPFLHQIQRREILLA